MNISVSITKCDDVRQKFFSVRGKQKGKCITKVVLVYYSSFNKATYNFIVHEKGARNLSTWVLEKLDITIITLVSETMKNIRKTWRGILNRVTYLVSQLSAKND